ncbi:MAG: response regulator [Deltaproteobacteria bacterium]|nr:response regulator [Deltaproteobacteria bacterium]
MPLSEPMFPSIVVNKGFFRFPTYNRTRTNGMNSETETPVKVLVVDDDELFLELMARILGQEYGHEVRTVSSGRKAMSLLEIEEFDVVITDIFMPDFDGIELIMALRKTSSVRGVVAMSAGGKSINRNFLDSASLLGADHVLQKPFDWSELHTIIQRVGR